jgi:DNA repair protein RadB
MDAAHLSASVPTLCRGLDSLLGGGLKRGALTTIFGARGVGKTSLSLQAAVSNALRGAETFFIFCDGAFPGHRLLNIAGERADGVSQLIHVAMPSSFAEQHKVLERFEVEVDDHPLTSLLVIDPIDALYTIQISLTSSPERDGQISESNFLLNKHLGLVANICRSRRVAALITCGARPSEDGPFEVPACARLMGYWSDNIVELTKGEDGFQLKPIKIRGRNRRGRGRHLRYEITDKGLVDCPAGEEDADTD